MASKIIKHPHKQQRIKQERLIKLAHKLDAITQQIDVFSYLLSIKQQQN